MVKSKLTLPHLFLYMLIFLLVFTLYEVFLTPLFPDTGMGWLLSSLCIFFIFTLPCLFIMRQYSDDFAIPFSSLWSMNFNPILLVFLCLIILIYTLSTSHMEDAIISVDLQYLTNNIMHSAYLDILAIELIFRAFLLNALIKRLESYQAVAWNSLLYFMTFLIYWQVQSANFSQLFESGSFIFLILLNICFSALFIQTKSIWPPLIIHSFWTLCLYYFI